jgi:AcrR family transcriptional regulator
VASTANNNERRDEIIATGARLFARNGIQATTMRDIGEACGILGGSLYYHFQSKDDIVEIILRRGGDYLQSRYDQALQTTGEPRMLLQLLIRTSVQHVNAHPAETAIFLNSYHYLKANRRFDFISEWQDRHYRMWLDVVSAGIATGVFRADLRQRLFVLLLREIVWSPARWWPLRSGETVDDLADEMCALLLGGCLSSQPPAKARPRRASVSR